MSFPIVSGYANEEGCFFHPDQNVKHSDHVEIIDFINRYAATINSTDMEDLWNRCSSSVLFLTPRSSRFVSTEMIGSAAQKMTENFKTKGYLKSQVTKANYVKMDDSHYLVKIYFEIHFAGNNEMKSLKDIKATYIVAKEEGKWKMITQLDHQELSERMKEMGI